MHSIIKNTFLILIGFLLSQALWNPAMAQTKTISEKAKKHYHQAEAFLSARKFDEAISSLKKAVDKEPEYAEAYFRLGNIYERLLNPDQAKVYYEKSVQYKPDYRPFLVAYGILGDYAMQEGNYQQAKTYFEKYVALKPAKTAQMEAAKKRIASCDFAIEAMANPVPFEPVQLSNTVNAFPIQYFPAITADQQTLIFTARRSTEYNGGDENLYVSYKRNGEWASPEAITEINTPGNEGTCSISADGRTLVFTACQERKGYGSCDLYISYKTGDKWSEPVNLGGSVNTGAWESQPSLSADGRTLYFVSDRPGGYGLHDIWTSQRGDDDKWSTPVNLGPTINTADFESSPFLHVNGQTLFFSSKGRVGLGGADLYYSELDVQGNWSEARNLGYPINSFGDQVSLIVTADGKKGYYASQEKKGMLIQNSYLHEFDIPQQIALKNKSDYLKGTVYDSRTKKEIAARIELFNLNTGKLAAVMSSDSKTGEYLTVLTEGASYALYVNKEGYLFKSLYFDFADKKEHEPLTLDVYLEPLVAGSKGVLNNLFFATGEYKLEDKSKTELDKLIQLLNDNKSLKLEISGHTDDVGKDEDNKELSTKRAKSVYDYLVKSGIATSRLKYTGYGETQFMTPNTSDENRQLNRRIEFKVL